MKTIFSSLVTLVLLVISSVSYAETVPISAKTFSTQNPVTTPLIAVAKVDLLAKNFDEVVIHTDNYQVQPINLATNILFLRLSKYDAALSDTVVAINDKFNTYYKPAINKALKPPLIAKTTLDPDSVDLAPNSNDKTTMQQRPFLPS